MIFDRHPGFAIMVHALDAKHVAGGNRVNRREVLRGFLGFEIVRQLP